MKMNDFDYFKASNVELLEHVVAEFTDISTEPECAERTDFTNYEGWRPKGGRCYCGAGWMGVRSHVEPFGKHPHTGETIMNPMFASIFAWNAEGEEPSIMQELMGAERWELVFGSWDDSYADRIEAAKTLLLEEQLHEDQ